MTDRDRAAADLRLSLATVEPPGILTENRGLVLLLEILPLEHLVDFFHTVVDRNFVRKIGRKHERLGAHPLDRVSQGLLVTLAANEDSVAVKVITGMPFELEPAVLQFALETIDHERDPRRAALHKTDAECREPVKDPSTIIPVKAMASGNGMPRARVAGKTV